jgi:WD40 repeat protein
LKILFTNSDSEVTSAGGDAIIVTTNWKSNQKLREFRNHTNRIYGLAVSFEENTFLSGAEDKTLRVWDKDSAKEVWQHTHTNYI